MGVTGFIGGRGEAIAYVELTKFCRGGTAPYSWPRYLGEKGQTFDLLVELLGAGERTPFFFAQVKSTQLGFTRRQSKLQIDVPADVVSRMANYPAPAYVIGVHEGEQRAFLISVHGDMRTRIRSITTTHELTPETLAGLWEEVCEFWRGHDMTRKSSRFLNEGRS
jgi:hypothetical protein